MRLATLARRTTALTAAVALLTTGGAATGLLGGVASAVGMPVVGSANPNAAFNTATATIVINGNGFIPAEDTVRFVPAFAPQPGGALVSTISAKADPNSTNTALSVSVPFTLAAPGPYDIIVDQALNAQDPAASSSTPCIKCFVVTSVGPATTSSVVRGALPSNSKRTGNVLDIGGSNFAKGAGVTFFNPDCSVDTKLTFSVNNGDNAAATGGYPSSTLLQGDYTAAAGFTPGRHSLRVTNTDLKMPTGDCSSGAVDFYQPYFQASGVNPPSRGAGSAKQTITVTGQGFRQGSTMSVQNLDTANGCSDVATGTSTVSADGTTISAPVTLQDNCNKAVSLAGRSISIAGPDGARYSVANAFLATAPPAVTSLTRTALGRGGSLDNVTINGTGFQGGATPTVFSLGGGGVTVVTKQVLSSTQALVTLVAASDAVLGGRSVTATNSDAGTSTTGPSGIPSTYPLTINPAPVPTNLSPSSTGKGTSRNVIVTGTGFDANMSVLFSGTGVTPGTVTVTKGSNGNPDTATFQVNVDVNAPAGLRDVVFTNSSDGGSYTCTACFGVDSLGIAPAADGNTSSASNVTLTGANMTSGGKVSLLRPGADPATAITANTTFVNTTTATATLNLLNEAPGKYNVTYTGTSDNVPLTCASCFTITGQTPTFTSITPAAGGQGAINLPFTVKGTKFAKGSQVTIAGATVHDVAFVDPQTLTGQVDIPANAATGGANVKVLTADGSLSSNTGTFTINAGPVVKTISPAALGQGAKGVTITVKGTGFITADSATNEPGSSLDLGPGVTVTNVVVTQGAAAPPADDTLTATVDVAQGVATGARNVVVTNSDAGRGVLSGAFTVNAGPVVSSITPAVLARGAADQAITVTGTGFASDATLAVDGLTFSSPPTVSSDGTTITGNGSVAADATRGARDVVVTNPTDKGQGTCAACFTIADLPGAPTIRSTTPGVTSVQVSWSPPADNGGSAITQYTLTADDGTSAVSVAGDQTSATLNGLTGGRTYTLTLTAQNAQGVGPGATTSATPYDVPLPPTAVSATGGSGYVDVSWSGEDARGNPITEYTVRYSNGASSLEQVVTAPASSTRINGLSNGTTYTFTVKAMNAAGYGAYSTASATGSPTYTARLTSTRTPLTALARAAVTYSGRLTRNDGTGIGGAAITVKLTPDIGASRNIGVTTAADGTWSFRYAPTYNTTVAASFGGDAQNAAVTALTYKQSVKTRVVRQSPATGQTTRASSTLAVKGYTTPNKAGRTIGLYEGSRLVARATVTSSGYFTLNSRLPRGTHTVHIAIGTTSGNVPGDSGNFVVKRS